MSTRGRLAGLLVMAWLALGCQDVRPVSLGSDLAQAGEGAGAGGSAGQDAAAAGSSGDDADHEGHDEPEPGDDDEGSAGDDGHSGEGL